MSFQRPRIFQPPFFLSSFLKKVALVGRAQSGSEAKRGAQTYLDVLKHIGVIADFSQLHDGVHESLGASLPLRAGRER